MRLLPLFALIPAFMLLAGASATAQTDGHVAGVYRVAMSIDSIRYRLPSTGYTISTRVIDGDTLPILEIRIPTADAEQGGLPASPMMKGKQAVDIRFFRETAASVYEKIVWTEFRIAGVVEENGDTRLQFVAEPEFDVIPLPLDSPMPVPTKVLRFPVPALEITGDDWPAEELLER